MFIIQKNEINNLGITELQKKGFNILIIKHYLQNTKNR